MAIVRFLAFVSSGEIPRFKLRANVCFGHVVVHYFILPLQLKSREILLQGQNKERALLGS
jgi:hypothetical protein